MGDQNRAWNFPIQWSRSFGEEIRFRTEIITSRRGNEQRIAQRNNPRIGYDFESFLKFDDFREALQRLNDNQGQPIHFPHPQFATELTTTTSGATFSVLQNPGYIREGDRVFLDNGQDREMIVVDSINGTQITPQEPLVSAFDIGTTVRRGVSGYVNGESKLTAATSRLGLSQIDIDADPVDTWHPDYSAVPETFNSKEFFNLGNQWASDVRVEFMQPVIELDLQRADVDRIFPTPFTTRKTRLRFVLRNQDHIDRLVGLFYRSRGRQKSFYMTTRLDEIRPLSIAPGSTFTVLGQDFARRFSDNDMYRFIQIKTADLTLTTEIVQVTVDVAGNSVGTITDIFNDAIPAETIKSIQWICLSRFESDTLSLEWITDGVAEATVNFRTLEDPA